MSSRKTERQLDLLFILLNASRPLSREAIRQKIDEYRNQENSESFERMFERDKDELRAVGVPIETKLINPLFEDEFGYELRLENLSYQESIFTNSELAELTRAALVWEDSLLAANARLGLVKSSIESGESLELLDQLRINNLVSSHHYVIIAEALVKKLAIEFDYIKPNEINPVTKKVYPESVFTDRSNLYLKAIDLQDTTIKSFNLSRITSDVVAFELSPQEISNLKRKNSGKAVTKKIARIKPRLSPDKILHTLGGVEVAGWVEVEYFEEDSFAIFVAPLSHQIERIEPKSLNDLVIMQLQYALKKLA